MSDNKWKVLIVDDEFRIGMLINKLINWDDFHMECAGVIDNGESALEVVEKQQPEIVITDIRMPKVSGLDLIRLTREQRMPIKFVVISGYKEFEYAQQALQYGVSDYLLKPVNENELNEVLLKLYNELELETKATKEIHEYEKKITASEQIIKRDLLNSIIEQSSPMTEWEVKNDYNVEMNAPVYRGIDIKLDIIDPSRRNQKQDKITVTKIISIIEKRLEGSVEEKLICEKENLHIYCLFNYEHSRSKDIVGVINGILTEIQEYLIGFEQYDVTIGIGNQKTVFGEIRYSIQESCRAVSNRIKYGTGRLIYADTIDLEKKITAGDYLRQFKEEYLKCIDVYNRVGLEQNINQIYSRFQFDEALDYTCCYEIGEELIKYFFNHIDDQREENETKNHMMEYCQQCRTIFQMKDYLKRILGEYLEVMKKATEAESTKPIRQAKQYIDEYYQERIVLEDIAQVVGLNPVYFSVIFKKETGMNFSAYLVYLRMEKAKEMLCSTNETIAAIAEKVGYKDSRYFSQIFTKTVGIKPALYRKLHA